jgi:hypothetical protein
MTVTDYYTTLPAELRGSALEAHTGWPRRWTTTDTHRAMLVAVALRNVAHTGGVPLDVTIVSRDTGTTVEVNRADVAGADRQATTTHGGN